MKKLTKILLLAAIVSATTACKDEAVVTPGSNTDSSTTDTTGTGTDETTTITNATSSTCQYDDTGIVSTDSEGDTPEVTVMATAITPATLWNNTADNTDYDTDTRVDNTCEDYIENSSFDSITISVTWNGTSATVTGSADSISINVSGGDVVINSTAKKVHYILSGNGTDGMFKLYSTRKYELTLNGLTLHNADEIGRASCRERV